MSSEPDFPPYTYTPGVTPHPIRDPAGHSYGRQEHHSPIENERLEQRPDFVRGRVLFVHGFYWEAHEEWEQVWHALGRSGPEADFVKALIKLAAAGVKAREGNGDGVRRHALRALNLFSGVRSHRQGRDLAGMPLHDLEQLASAIASGNRQFPKLDHGCPVTFWPSAVLEVDGL